MSKSTSLSDVGVPSAYDPKRMIFSGLSSATRRSTTRGKVSATGRKPVGWIFVVVRNMSFLIVSLNICIVHANLGSRRRWMPTQPVLAGVQETGWRLSRKLRRNASLVAAGDRAMLFSTSPATLTPPAATVSCARRRPRPVECHLAGVGRAGRRVRAVRLSRGGGWSRAPRR